MPSSSTSGTTSTPGTTEADAAAASVPAAGSTSPVLIAAAWILVLLPTAWGFSYTLQNAMKLFASTAPTAPAAPAAQPSTAR